MTNVLSIADSLKNQKKKSKVLRKHAPKANLLIKEKISAEDYLTVIQDHMNKIDKRAASKIKLRQIMDNSNRNISPLNQDELSKKERRTELEDNELPAKIRHQNPWLESNSFLKLYAAKNQTHDRDREQANSIVRNLSLPTNMNKLEQIPFFSREKQMESMLNLHVTDLYQIGQIEHKSLHRLKSIHKFGDLYDDFITMNNSPTPSEHPY